MTQPLNDRQPVRDNMGRVTESLSHKEVDHLAKHFTDPTFVKMFQEYMEAIADPKIRAEQDAYLAQLENEGQLEGIYGKGVQTIQSEPGIAIKTKTADGAVRVYINVCTCCKVDLLSLDQIDGRTSMQLPNIISNRGIREGKVADGVIFKVCDFIIHPESLSQCLTKPAMLDTALILAIEKVEASTGMKLLRKYKLLQVQYKGVDAETRPPALVLRTTPHSEVVDGRVRPQTQPSAVSAAAAAAAPATPAAVDAAPGKHTGERAGNRSTFTFGSKPQPSQSTSKGAAVSGFSATPAGVRTPDCQVVERARTDLGSTWSDAGRGLRISNVPEALVVRVDLPGVNSVAAIDLTMAAQGVTLEVPSKYKLQLPLRYKVNEQQATAKFLTSKQQLVLTLPVIPPKAEQLSQQQQQHQHQQQDVGVAQQADHQCKQHGPLQQLNTTAGHSDTPLTSSLVVEVPPGNASSNTQQASSTDSAAGDQAGAASTEQALAAISPAGAQGQDAAVKTANQLMWEQLHGNSNAAEAGSSVQQGGQGVQAAAQQALPAGGEQPKSDQQQSCAVPTAAKAASIRPRLSSRRVCASDFI